MSRRTTSSIAAGLVLALGLASCTGGDAEQAADERPVEVRGEVLDRRDDTDEAEPAEDAKADEADDTGADEETSETDGAGAVGDPDDAGDRAAAAAEGARSGSTGDADGPTASAPTSGGSPPRSSTPAPRSPSTTPAPAPAPSPAPTPVATPTPAATPAPRTVAAGPAHPTGPVLDSDGTDWVVSSSRSLERGQQPPAMTVALLPGEDAPRRQVRCQAALQAPSDRGLVVRGTLTVSLRIELPDGTISSLPRQRHDLDVTLAAGRRLDLAVSPPRELDVTEVRQVACVAELTS